MAKPKFELRPPKGTVDLSPKEALTHKRIVERVVSVFEKHGAQPVETPSFELRDVLANKYGEEARLVYDLADQGGDICSLRYDLTVPFARYAAMNRVSRLRRYTVGRVYRRDNPSFRTGRLREFTQADFDICGSGVPMAADAEVLAMLDEILRGVRLAGGSVQHVIRISDRRVLAGLLLLAGVPSSLLGTICSTVDKADKLCWPELAAEFSAKGLVEEQLRGIKDFLEIKGSNEEILCYLEKKANEYKPEANNTSKRIEKIDIKETDNKELVIKSFVAAIEELKILLEYTKILQVETVRIDLSLARGLDYYTGIIIEASYEGLGIGSIAGGGRYDNLCSSISSHSVPCVGFSVGISRLMAVAAKEDIAGGIFVGSAHGLLISERLAILQMLWTAGFTAQTFPGRRANYKEQLETARRSNCGLAIFTGEDESSKGVLILYDIRTDRKEEIKQDDLLSAIKKYSI